MYIYDMTYYVVVVAAYYDQLIFNNKNSKLFLSLSLFTK